MQNDTGNVTATRIRDDDELIDLPESLEIMGGMSVSTAYSDPELMALKINMTAPGLRSRMVRFIKREIYGLRAQRVARRDAAADAVRTRIEAQIARRNARRRERQQEAQT